VLVSLPDDVTVFLLIFLPLALQDAPAAPAILFESDTVIINKKACFSAVDMQGAGDRFADRAIAGSMPEEAGAEKNLQTCDMRKTLNR